jgi:hypothetical protein
MFTRIHPNLVINHGNVIGCPNWKFADVYVKLKGKGYMNAGYHTIMTIDGALYGKLDTKNIPNSINKLPVGKERSQAVSKWYKDMENCAKKLVAKHGLTC